MSRIRLGDGGIVRTLTQSLVRSREHERKATALNVLLCSIEMLQRADSLELDDWQIIADDLRLVAEYARRKADQIIDRGKEGGQS